ncbi:type II RES/Xre toxin-antitoxin system antitoxin [Noviherbaspirillum malthae]|uniref:type II RES/Xre toxin-antitoxin system antitoxin n=1 Tax=Noviherbaspirillum malthae TaxID=1260987 RepID=UPI00188F4BCA|nr:antitoxin Xre/MbcA/ParS toxin-binding domain-containing protein [Noviherbaspirillum malthae]
MKNSALQASSPPQERGFAKIINFLGGNSVLQHEINTGLDAHHLINQGLPGVTVKNLQNNVKVLRDPNMLQKAIGISLRTTQRKVEPSKDLNETQSGRVWKFAEILATATEVLGSQDEAERWLTSPAMGLEQRCPIELLSTPAGVELVEELLTRMQFGVYA